MSERERWAFCGARVSQEERWASLVDGEVIEFVCSSMGDVGGEWARSLGSSGSRLRAFSEL